MKIMQVSAIDATMNVLLRELNTTIQKDGHHLICVCSEGPRVQTLREEGFDVRTINIDRKISPVNNLKSIINMYKLFKKEKPDIVHVHTPVASVLGRIAAKLAKVPTIIYTAHGFYFHENMSPKKYKMFYLIEKLIARCCTDYIFTQSEEDGQLAIENHFLPTSQISIISNGVDVDAKFNPANFDQKNINSLKVELNINDDDIVVSFVGRLVKEKGILDLLEAFSRIEQDNVKLLVIGDISSSERDHNIKNQIKSYQANPRIIFTGFRSDISELFYISDIYCLPSYREGMPRSIIEAMAMECAIIATNIRGSREEVDNGENGYLVGLNNPREIESAIVNLANDSELLEEFKKNARYKALNLYNEKNVVKKQMDIFKALESKKQGGT